LRNLTLALFVTWCVPQASLALRGHYHLLPSVAGVPPGDPATADASVAPQTFAESINEAEAAPLDATGHMPPDTPSVEPRPSWGWAAVLSTGVLGLEAASSFADHPEGGFHVTEEDWFGENTFAGGGDKVAHFAKFEITARELAVLYEHLGFSHRQSALGGFAVSWLAGLLNELGDATNAYGFSYEDLTMDTLGAGSAALVSLTDTGDLFGFRAGIVIGDPPPREVPSIGRDYSHEIYTADLQLGGVARRLGVSDWPIRFLLVSGTYGVWGYPYGGADQRQRLIGLELGLNFAEMLHAFNVKQDTWWGILAHLLFDNFRIPYTQAGFRFDLNRHGWYAVNSSNQ
jgi:uncharacterized protein YfiM (DUF2279 family)